jgi:hypothetical protein
MLRLPTGEKNRTPAEKPKRTRKANGKSKAAMPRPDGGVSEANA